MADWDRWVWLAGSFLLAVVVAQVFWRLRRADDPPVWVSKLLAWPYSPSLFLVVRFLFYVGVPFSALIWGRDAVVGRRLGLQPLLLLRALSGEPASAAEMGANWADWARDVGWSAGLGIAAWALMAVGWWVVGRAPTGRRLSVPPTSPGRSLLEAAFHEVHWAFYRNAPIVTLELYTSVSPGLYWGAWAGLALVGLEASLSPGWWADLGSGERAPTTAMRAVLAVLSVVLALLTENLWLAVLTHWLVSYGLTAWMRGTSKA